MNQQQHLFIMHEMMLEREAKQKEITITENISKNEKEDKNQNKAV